MLRSVSAAAVQGEGFKVDFRLKSLTPQCDMVMFAFITGQRSLSKLFEPAALLS